MGLKPWGWKAGESRLGIFGGFFFGEAAPKSHPICLFKIIIDFLKNRYGVISAKFHLFRPLAPSPPWLFRRCSSAAPGAPPGSLGVPLKEGIQEFWGRFAAPLFHLLRQAGILAAASIPGAGD